MPDPRLVSRAQRAATMLERAWDRWRAAHGLAAEPLPPVSSYVGYSIEEPWGRPRVVFGVDAADAEKLATLLQECAASSQQSMDEVRARIPAQGRTAQLNGTRELRSGAQAAVSVNGFGPAQAHPHPEDQILPDHVPDNDTADFAVQSDGNHDPAVPGHGSNDPEGASLGWSAVPGDAPDEDSVLPANQDGLAAPDSRADDDQEPSAGAGSQDPGGTAEPGSQDPGDTAEPGTQDPGDSARPHTPADSDAGDHGDSGHGVAETMAAELAGWAAGELPGQASARLAAWATAGAATARSGLDADLRAAGGAAEPAI